MDDDAPTREQLQSELAQLRRRLAEYEAALKNQRAAEADERPNLEDGEALIARKLAEEALRQSEVRYRHITDTLTDYIYTVQVVDGQPTDTRHGPGCVAVTGYTSEEFAADPYLWIRMVVPEDRPRVQAQARQVLDGRDTPALEHRLVRKDGMERWVRNTPVPHHAEGGRLTSYDGLIQDITDRRRAEEALKVSEARYRSLIETQTEIIARSNPAGQLTFVNEAYCRMFGQSPAELIGSSFLPIIWPEDVPIALSALTTLQQPPYRASTETRHVTPRGMRWISWENTAIVDENNRVLELQGAGRDITEQKLAEEALRATRDQLVTITDNIPILIAHFSPDQRYIYVNAEHARFFRQSPAYFTGRHVREIIGEAAYALASPNIKRVLAGEPVTFENVIRNADGQLRSMLVQSTPERDSHGQIIGYFSLIQDITERKEMEAALRQERALLAQRVDARTAELSTRTAELQRANADLVRASRLKDEFLANMSHELRTPLTAILGLAEALQLGSYGPVPDKQSQVLQVIRQSGQHLLSLITDILDLSKIEAGKVELQVAPAAVSDICQSSLHFIKPLAQKKNIRVTFASDPLVRLILIDARRLKQMVVNLLGNAVKFTPEGGQVGLEVVGDPVRREVRFVVWDTGIGIPAEKQELLFRSFVQVDGGLTRKYEGAGLGLALTRRLAEIQGGQVSVESAGVGQGSRFIITLPWRPAETPQQLLPRRELAATLVTPSGRPAVVLLADDNQATLMAVGDFLQSLSAKVMTAMDGPTALAQARALKPDLIIMDIQIPGLDGLEAIQELRAAPETARTPIIALTALAMIGDRERCLNAGANDYFSKPVKLDELIRCAMKLIAQADAA